MPDLQGSLMLRSHSVSPLKLLQLFSPESNIYRCLFDIASMEI